MRNLLKYFKDYKKEAILGPIFKLLEAVFDLIVPIIVSLIIDNGILKSDNKYVIKMCLLLVALAIIGIVIAIIAQYFAAKASVGLGSKLREKLFNHVQKLSFKELDQTGESTIINRIVGDTLQVQSGVNLLLRLVLRAPLIVFGSLIMACVINLKIGLIFLVTIPIISLIIYIVTKICVSKYEAIQEKKDSLLNIIKENLAGARVIRAFGIENKEYSNFKNENSSYTNMQKSASRVSSSMNSLNYLVINFGIIGIIALGGKQVNNGIISQGQVVALYNYMSQILVELIKLTNLLLLMPKTFASAKRIDKMLNTENSMKNGELVLKENNIKLDFKNVSLNYLAKSKESLTNISFSVKTGEVLGIIGGTGAGKTSIVNLIPRFYDVTSGAIEINGRNIKEYEQKSIRESIGIVMQNKVLFKGTIKENIQFGKENLSDDEIERAIEISQASDILKNKEKGINEIVEENGKNFSGGQKQRLTIARVISKNPKILILDDSMSALDLATDRRLRKEINKIKKDKIIIIVSQRISTIQDADKILVVDNGKVVGEGKHNELINSCGIYKEICDSQVAK